MKQQELLYRISQLLSRFTEQVKILNSNHEFSINIHAENILIGIFDIIFNCKFENVNYRENKVYPSIDLRDRKNRIAIQVTASSHFEKIKHTLSEFVANNFYKDYDALYIYVITERHKSYSQKSIDAIVGGMFTFSTKNIIDKSYIYKKLNDINDIQKIEVVCQLLEKQFADNKEEYDKWDLYCKGLYEYDQYITKLYKFLDIRGFSPRINNTLVKLDIDKIYVPLKFKIDFSNNVEQASSKDKMIYDIVTALENYDRVVILGDPGSGKSTSLKYLAYTICSHRADNNRLHSYIPIVIKATDYAKYYSDTRRSLSEYIIEIDRKYGFLFSKSLETNELIVLFDGLDEINVINNRHAIVDKINSFSAQYPSIKIIVSSRIVGYNETSLGCRFFHFKVEQFSDEQILLFIENWYSSISSCSDHNLDIVSHESEKLYNSIIQNTSVYKLACNPLLMTIIALIYYQGSKLPEKRVQLYDISTSTLLDNWVQLRANQKNNIDREVLVELLAIIAFHIHEKYASGLIPEKELRIILKEGYSKIHPYLPPKELKQDINDIISFLREDAGFLFEKGYNENGEALFGFIHLTFQEYFAAIEFNIKWREGSIRDALQNYVYNSNWTEVVKVAASLLKYNEPGRLGRSSATKFVTDILKVEEILPGTARHIHLVCQILNEDVEIEFDTFNTIVDILFNQLLSVDETAINASNIFIFENCFVMLLAANHYRNYVLDRIIDKINSNSSPLLTQRLISLLMRVSDNTVVQDYLLSILQSDKVEIKEYMFEYRTVFPVADIVNTSQFCKEIVEYVNSPIYSHKYSGHLPTQYCCCFKEDIKDWIYSISLIKDDRMKKDLIDFYVFSWGISDVDELRSYIEEIKKNYSHFKLDRIEEKLAKLERSHSLGLDEYPILEIDDIEIYKIKGNVSSYAVKHDEDMMIVEAPFKSVDFKCFIGEQSTSFVQFCNMVIYADNTESKEIIVHDNEELNLLMEYSDAIHWYASVQSNMARIYALSHLFVNDEIDTDILKYLKKEYLKKRCHIELNKSFNTNAFEELVRSSSLDVFDKLVLMRLVNPQFADNEMLSLAIEEYNKIEPEVQKSECRAIIYSLI